LHYYKRQIRKLKYPLYFKAYMTNLQGKKLKDWLKFFDANEVKFQLICASLYLTAYELLIQCVVEKIKNFFICGIEEGEVVYDAEYKKVRLLYPKDIVIASSLWLHNNDAISETEVEAIKGYKTHRNDLAHELPKIISETEHEVKIENFKEMRDLYRKINLWWLKEVELGINPDFDDIDHSEIDFDEALIFVMLPMDYIVNIVNDEIETRIGRKRS
jgi:hypothetical protein